MTIGEGGRPGNHNLSSFFTPVQRIHYRRCCPKPPVHFLLHLPIASEWRLENGSFQLKVPRIPQNAQRAVPEGMVEHLTAGFSPSNIPSLSAPLVWDFWVCLAHLSNSSQYWHKSLCARMFQRSSHQQHEQPEIILNFGFKIWIMNHVLSLSFYP